MQPFRWFQFYRGKLRFTRKFLTLLVFSKMLVVKSVLLQENRASLASRYHLHPLSDKKLWENSVKNKQPENTRRLCVDLSFLFHRSSLDFVKYLSIAKAEEGEYGRWYELQYFEVMHRLWTAVSFALFLKRKSGKKLWLLLLLLLCYCLAFTELFRAKETLILPASSSILALFFWDCGSANSVTVLQMSRAETVLFRFQSHFFFLLESGHKIAAQRPPFRPLSSV